MFTVCDLEKQKNGYEVQKDIGKMTKIQFNSCLNLLQVLLILFPTLKNINGY